MFLGSRATKYALAGEPTVARELSSTRQLTTLCLSSRPGGYAKPSLRTTPKHIQAYRVEYVPALSVRWNSTQSNTDDSSSPTFRKWGFDDINAHLPSESPSTPPSSPQKNLILVDVREPAELTRTGVIPSAVAVPLASQPDALFLTPDEFETRFGYPKPGADGGKGDIVFYCLAGVRAKAAAQLAVQAGYEPERIGVYEGSWRDWAARGGKVEKWEGYEE
ncbi:rhodanese-like domain-containing protein [Aspergillus foveolatus]|uniref:rhodanese-like domain-containing protein n=1 Tax=Aspergillus foveolatus TaxID=210207 RepID=UPI003CCD37CA